MHCATRVAQKMNGSRAAWATAIREIMIFIPRNNDNLVVVTELGSASITTVLAAGIAILVMSCTKKNFFFSTRGVIFL
jgi:hypothetical protein